MKHLVVAAVAAPLLLAGCSSVPTGPEVIATEGRVTEVRATEGQLAPVGAYQPGQGGAIGGAFAYLLRYSMGTKAHTQYVIRQLDGKERLVPATEKFDVGACVAVMTQQANQGNWYLKLGEARLQASTSCPTE
jgi:hypothetical protein